MTECCPIMQQIVDFECNEHRPSKCPDRLILKLPKGRHIMPVKDEGSSWYEVRFCPWCGANLGNASA